MLRIHLFLLFVLALIVSTSTSSQLEFNHRLWLNYCRDLQCAQTLEKCLDEINCSGEKQCKRCVMDIAAEDCSKCIDDIFNEEESIEEINGVKYFICNPSDSLQVLGCRMYCRGIFFPSGECIRETNNNVPYCKCLSFVEITWTGQITKPITTTTTTTTTLSTTTTPVLTYFYKSFISKLSSFFLN